MRPNRDANNMPGNPKYNLDCNNQNFVSVYRVMAELISRFPQWDFRESSIIEWSAKVQRFIGSYYLLTKKSIPTQADLIENRNWCVSNYEICLPDDCIKLLSMRCPADPFNALANFSFSGHIQLSNGYFVDDITNINNNWGIRYQRNGNYLRFNFTDFPIQISYLGCPVDENGYPYIFEGSLDACVYYCIWKYAEMGMLDKKFSRQDVEYWKQQYAFYIKQARAYAFEWNSNDDDIWNATKAFMNMKALPNKTFNEGEISSQILTEW